MVDVLYARKDSIYKTLEECEVWDAQRDARNCPGGNPVVAHPPCAQWGRMRGLANVNPVEKSLAVLAVLAVRKFGGVLEHPYGSQLWKHCRLPNPGRVDKWGGFTLPVLQQWWGHRAAKPTLLYICGINPESLPQMPFVMGEPQCHVGGSMKRTPGHQQRELPKPERTHTPILFAKWLVEIANLTALRSSRERCEAHG